MISLATLGRIDGYTDAKLGRQPQVREQSHRLDDGEDFAAYAAAYTAAYRAAQGAK